MLNNLKQRKNSEGFTIIEVLIVLAIAGLILLVVFLAVPNLQRNSRNTQARNEAAIILGAVSEYNTNSGGKTLTAGISSGSATADADAKAIKALANTKNVTTLKIEAYAAKQTVPTESQATIVYNAKCANASQTAIDNLTTSTTSRQIAIVYLIEDSAGALYACQSS